MKTQLQKEIEKQFDLEIQSINTAASLERTKINEKQLVILRDTIMPFIPFLAIVIGLISLL